MSAPERYLALDAFRGAVMLLLLTRGLGKLDHRPWEGLSLWDLILPAFFFIVGAAIPFALTRRRPSTARAALRAAKLIVLAVVVSSAPAGQLRSPVMEVLFHIAFTYFFCYLILRLPFRWQAVTAAAILLGHLALYLQYPLSKTGNAGAVIDRALLGASHPGFYASINIVPGIVSTLFGGWAALLLMRGSKLAILGAWASASLAVGYALSPWVPIVKRIYTLSYTLVSAGWILAALIVCVWIIDVRGYRRWTFPLTVVGMNCIFAYTVLEMLGAWLDRAVGAVTGSSIPLRYAATALVIWYLCYWLWQRKIVFKL